MNPAAKIISLPFSFCGTLQMLFPSSAPATIYSPMTLMLCPPPISGIFTCGPLDYPGSPYEPVLKTTVLHSWVRLIAPHAPQKKDTLFNKVVCLYQRQHPLGALKGRGEGGKRSLEHNVGRRGRGLGCCLDP